MKKGRLKLVNNQDITKNCLQGLLDNLQKAEENMESKEFYQAAQTYALSAIAFSLYSQTFISSCKCNNKNKEEKEKLPAQNKPATKDDLEDNPSKVNNSSEPLQKMKGSEDTIASNIGTDEEKLKTPIKKEDKKQEKKQESSKISDQEINKKLDLLTQILPDWVENKGVPEENIKKWMSQTLGVEIKNYSEVFHNVDKLPKLLEYFEKLKFIFTDMGATANDVSQALNFATNGHYTDINGLKPENVELVIDVLKECAE